MLVHCLEVTSPSHGTPSAPRSFLVRFLGAEKELNFIPLSSELALLLPYHDIITFAMLGPAVTKAKLASSPLATKTYPSHPVLEYRTPAERGPGTISVYFLPYWKANDVPTHKRLDALVACDTGFELLQLMEQRPQHRLSTLHSIRCHRVLREFSGGSTGLYC
uniref:Mitochondrial splicing suppressor 51-like C-terminal domain-containing protein n=1 Tax=Moniliophthora roreri TaxID=221103 RepID=A0A0W0G7H6_MONRR